MTPRWATKLIHPVIGPIPRCRVDYIMPARLTVEQLVAQGWNYGMVRPPAPGIYARYSILGKRDDIWDGKVWRRLGSPIEDRGTPYNGIACANQELPWKTV